MSNFTFDADGNVVPTSPRTQQMMSTPKPAVTINPEIEDAQEEYEGSQLGDIMRGVGSGVLGVPQGVITLPTLALDFAFDTDITQNVDEAFEKLRDTSGLQPETNAGQVAETISTFVTAAIPVVGWMGTASKAATAARAGATVPEAATATFRAAQNFGKSKTGQALLAPTYAQSGSRAARAAGKFQAGAATSLAAGLSDAVVAPSGTATLSDSFDVLPEILRTEQDTTLQGRERVVQDVKNKLKIATESTLLGVAVGDIAFPAAAAVVGATGKGIGYGVQKAADVEVAGQRFGNVVNSGFDVLSQKLKAATPDALKTFGAGAKEFGQRYFTSAKGLPVEVARNIDDTVNSIGAYEKFTLKLMGNYHNELVRYFGRMSPLFGKGKEGYNQAYDDLVRYLEGDADAMTAYPKQVQKSAEKMAELRNNFSEAVHDRMDQMFKNGEFGEGTQARELYASAVKTFKENEGKYLRRVFQRNIGANEIDIEQTIKQFDQLEKQGTLPKKFKLAVQEVENLMEGMGGDYAALSARQRREAAIKFVYDNVRKRVAEADEAPEEALAPFVEANKSNLRTKIEGSFLNPFAEPQARVAVREGALKGRSQIIDNSPLLRELMGETKGTKLGAEARYFDTMMTLVKLNESTKLYQGLMDTPGLTATADDIINGTAVRPMIVRAEEAASLAGQAGDRSFKSFMDDYVAVPANTNSIFGGEFGALSGHYVRKELFDALTNLPYNRGAMGMLASAGVRTKSYLQQAVVTLNPVALARNTFGGGFFMTANGHIPRGGDLFDSLGILLGKVGSANQEAAEEFLLKGQRLGVVDQSVRANEIAELARGTLTEAAVKPTTGPLQIFNRRVKERLGQGGVLVGQKAKDIAKLPYRIPQAIQQFGDSFYKLAGWNAERARLDGAMRSAMIDAVPDQTGRTAGPGFAVTSDIWDDLADDFVAQGLAKRTRSSEGDNFFDTWTADTITDNYPSYFKIPTAGRAVIRFPVMGNFVGFMSEIIRNSNNILARAGREINFRATPEIAEKLGRRIVAAKGLDESMIMEVGERAANTLAREMNAIGAKRATGLYTTAFMSSGMIAAGAAALLGLTDEEMQAVQDSKSSFYEGQTVVPLSKPKDGKVEYMPIAYYNPYDSIGSSVGVAMEAYAKGERLGEDYFSNIFGATVDGMGKFLQPFTDESLLYERIADVAPFARAGKTKTGRLIYREQPSIDGRFDADDAEEKLAKSISHLMGALTPAGTDIFYEFDPSQAKTLGDVFVDPKLKKGRVLKAVQGEPTSGRQILDPAAEIGALGAGARSIVADNKRALQFDALAYARARTAGPLGEFNAERRKADTTLPRLRRQWYDSQQEQFANAQELYLTMQRGEKTGLSRSDIRRELRENNVTKRDSNALMKGRFDFARVSDRFLVDVRREIRNDPALKKFYSELEQDPNREILTVRDMRRALSDLNRLSRRNSNRLPLDEPFPPYEFFFPDEAPVVEPQSSIMPQVTEEPVNIAAAQLPSAPTPSTVTPVAAAQQPVNPSLLGDNPMEVARNMELANRLRGRS
jgi:hypothetical protein